MTNQLAIVFAIAIIAAFAADFTLADGTYSLFLARKFADLLEWIAFWR